MFGGYSFKITTTSIRSLWVNQTYHRAKENRKMHSNVIFVINLKVFLVKHYTIISPEQPCIDRWYQAGLWWVAIGLLTLITLQWRHDGRDGVSNHKPHHCLLNRLFRRGSKITSKLRVTGLCVGNSPVTSEFPAQMASNAGNVSIWWRHHEKPALYMYW